ncbi:hypothetical protein FXO37_09989, partial [Capsicum annuum]
MNVEPECVSCQAELETRDHLFFKCKITNAIWTAILKWQRWGECPREIGYTCESGLEHRTRGTHTLGVILKASLAAVVHTFWLKRNSKVFQKQTTVVEELIRAIKIMLSIRVRTNPKLFGYI